MVDLKQSNSKNSKVTRGKLVDFTDFQEGSIVSKTLIDKKSGTVTVFAFDKGQGLSEHTAPYDALVYLIDGEAYITISGSDYHLKRGEIIIIPANEPHALQATKRLKMMLTMIKS